MRFTGSLGIAAGVQNFVYITPTLTQSGTAAYTALLINPTTATTGSGAQLLQDWQIDSVSRMSLSSAGLLTLNPGTTPSTALLLDIAAPAASGAEVLRNSHLFDLRSRMHTSADVQHYSDWTMQAYPAAALAGVSLLTIATSVDGGAALTALQLGFIAGTMGAFWFGDPASANTSWTIKPTDKSTGNLAGDEARYKAGKAYGNGNGGDWYGDAGAHGTGSGTHGAVKLGTSVASSVLIAQSDVLTTVAGPLDLPGIGAGSGTAALMWDATGGVVTQLTSDERVKDNFADYAHGLADLRRLGRPRWYDHHDAHLSDGKVVWDKGVHRRFGWTAQDVDAALPGVAYIPSDPGTAFASFQRQDLVPALFNATLEIDDEVQVLKRRVGELEAEVATLRAA
jgi:hypothetical protein